MKRKSNEYMREYMARRYDKRRAWAIDLLGGKCVDCKSTDDLQFDHIDPGTKSFTIAKRLAGISQKLLEEELAKCQLLCPTCHISKTKQDGVAKPVVGEKSNLSKLTESQVLEIRAKYKPRVYTMAKLAAEYGVTVGNVKQIVSRKTWKHI